MLTEGRQRQDIMLCYPFEEKRLEKWGYPVIVQPKLDGERCRAVWHAEGWRLLSSSADDIISVPHINVTLDLSDIPKNIELDGELYLHGMEFEDIHSIVSRTVNIHDDFDTMHYHVFDHVSDDVQLSRLMDIDELFLKLPLVRVPRVICQNFDQLWGAYEEFIKLGYEGIIIRHVYAAYVRRRCTTIMKFKPKKSDWYTVVSVKEGMRKFKYCDNCGWDVGQSGEVLVDSNDDTEHCPKCSIELSVTEVPGDTLGAIEFVGEDMDGSTGWVGSGLTDARRRELWDLDITGWLIHVQYQHITPGKSVPRFPVFLDVVDPKSFE